MATYMTLKIKQTEIKTLNKLTHGIFRNTHATDSE